MKKEIYVSIIILSLIIILINPLTVMAKHAKKLNQSMNYNLDIVKESDWEETQIGEYPIDVEKKDELSYTEAIYASDMPDAYATTLSTEELVEYAMNYPFLTDVYGFDSIEDGLKSFESKSGLFKELFSRKDGLEKLIYKYKEIECDYDEVVKTDDITESNYDAVLFIEEYVGDHFDEVSDDLAEIFIDEFAENYDEMPDELAESDISMSMYHVMEESLGHIPKEAVPENIENDIVLGERMGASFTKGKSAKCAMCGGKGYNGTQSIQGKNISCFKHNSAGNTSSYTSTTKSYCKNYNWTYVRGGTAKYNCHSYAWYNTSSSNSLWIDNPYKIYTDTKYYTKWRIPMVDPKAGSREIFLNSDGLQHSAILNSTKVCTSKLGHLGVVRASVQDIKTFYGCNKTEIYLVK